ncbi:MAG: tetratricopeptide repeat protein [Myxococcota bacterium]
MKRVGSKSVVWLGLALVLGMGCGAATVGQAVAPEPTTAEEALGEDRTCREVAAYAQPLVVDWTGQQRLDLELAMKRGVAVVAYDCARFELLPRCRVVGDYRFAAVSQKEEVIKLESSDEIAANLPFSHVQLSSSLERGSSIDLGLVLIGKKTTTVSGVARPMLEGDCGGATHFVKAATLGGFSMARGVVGRARAAAEVFTASVSGGSDHRRAEEQRDGDLKACRGARADAEAPPDQCQAALRLDLAPVVASFPETDAPVAPAASTTGPRAEAHAKDEETCPAGMTRVGGKCADDAKGDACTLGGDQDCEKRCQEGDATACFRFGQGLHWGDGMKADRDRAVAIYVKACNGGVLEACTAGGMLISVCSGNYAARSGLNCEERKLDDALDLLLRACDGGEVGACAMLTLSPELLREIKRTPLSLFRRSCDLGDASSCGIVGSMYLDGEGGAPRDPETARGHLSRACFGGERSACRSLARLYRGDVAGEAPRGRELVDVQMAACRLGDTEACDEVGTIFRNGAIGVRADPARAQAFFERACEGLPLQVDACRRAALTAPDLVTKLGHYVRACRARGALCSEASRVALQHGEEKLHGACRDGDGIACDRLAVSMLEKGCREDETAVGTTCRALEQRDLAAARRAYRWRCGLASGRRDHPACVAYARVGGTFTRPPPAPR